MITEEELENLIKERDYYKKLYLETNNGFIANIEAMLKDLKRSKLYEKGGNI